MKLYAGENAGDTLDSNGLSCLTSIYEACLSMIWTLCLFSESLFFENYIRR